MKDKRMETLLNKVRSLQKENTDPGRADLLKMIEDVWSRPVYKTLKASILSSLKDEELEQTIFDSISANIDDDKRDRKEILKSLTPGQQAIYVTRIVEAEVRNGGFNQFYFNSSGQLADVAEEAFRTIAAVAIADLIRKANLIFDEADPDVQTDSNVIEAFKNFRDQLPLSDLDDEFYRLAKEGSLDRLKIQYIKNNLSQFVSE